MDALAVAAWRPPKVSSLEDRTADIGRFHPGLGSRAFGSERRGSRGELIENRFRPADRLIRLAHPVVEIGEIELLPLERRLRHVGIRIRACVAVCASPPT